MKFAVYDYEKHSLLKMIIHAIGSMLFIRKCFAAERKGSLQGDCLSMEKCLRLVYFSEPVAHG